MRYLWVLLVVGGVCQAADQTVGNTALFPQIIVHDTRRAAPFIMPADGTIGSISIYHQGGPGAMLLGVYLGATAPDTLLAVTAPTATSLSEGWQTAPLLIPAYVPGGTQIWLSWVFQSNPGVRYQVMSPGWADSDQGWNTAMPTSFGNNEQFNHAYSIYASYVGNAALVINEVLFRNDTFTDSSFLDTEGTKQGWIELYNAGNLPVNLGGYYLSDSRDEPQKWAFPEMLLKPKQYLLVWGSGKNRRDPTRPLHASFNTMNSNSIFLTYTGIETPIDAVKDIFIPADRSYGRYPDRADAWYFYTRPTPGSANTAQNKQEFVVNQKHVSLTMQGEYQLTVTPPEAKVVWNSNNPLVSVSPAGLISALRDALGTDARAIITARSEQTNDVDSCQVTVIDWTANLSQLKVVETPSADYVLTATGKVLYFTKGQQLYATMDGFKTSSLISTLPEMPNDPVLLTTPFGYFIRLGKTMYKSDDLVSWTPTFAMNMGGLQESFDYDWDAKSRTGYLYASEYSAVATEVHRVYRGTFPTDGPARWETILEFTPEGSWQNDRSILTAARHIHIVTVDPYTGHVWVGTGDVDHHTRILYSDDHGNSFRLVGMGSQYWRTLSIWFSEHYVYWNMDTGAPQSVLRIPRSKFEAGGFWPCATPELASGMTKVGARYFITMNETPHRFPTTTGDIYTETQARPLDAGNRVRALNDPAYDYKEIVAHLDNGSLWYHLWATDRNGDRILLLCGAAEGALRDYRARVWGIWESPADGTCDIQELLSVPSTTPDTLVRYVRLEGEAQDSDGYIYFLGRYTDHRIYKTQLNWTNSR